MFSRYYNSINSFWFIIFIFYCNLNFSICS